MKANNAQMRQAMGCGYEPETAAPFVYSPEAMKPDVDEDGNLIPFQWCVGYTSRLPEVIEIARARVHWSKGSLAAAVGAPAEEMLLGLEILEGSSNELQSALYTPRSKGGLGDG